MGDRVELNPKGFVEIRVAMPMHVGPDRSVSIQVFAPVHIDQPTASAGGDNQGRQGQILAHLCERMPDVSPVLRHELFAERVLI
jgi:hypothetical protein